MKNIRIFLSENFHFLLIKFSVCLNRYVFVTGWRKCWCQDTYQRNPCQEPGYTWCRMFWLEFLTGLCVTLGPYWGWTPCPIELPILGADPSLSASSKLHDVMFGPLHHSLTHTIINTMMKQIKGFNASLRGWCVSRSVWFSWRQWCAPLIGIVSMLLAWAFFSKASKVPFTNKVMQRLVVNNRNWPEGANLGHMWHKASQSLLTDVVDKNSVILVI